MGLALKPFGEPTVALAESGSATHCSPLREPPVRMDSCPELAGIELRRWPAVFSNHVEQFVIVYCVH
jgi:hypothetical protein